MAPRSTQAEATRRHLLRFPECEVDDIEARTWHGKAKKYWELLGNKFNQEDQQRFCEAARRLHFGKCNRRTISQHPIAREAVRDPNWPALIMLQLGFKMFVKFGDIAIGNALSTAFPSADLSFPVPNGSPYVSLDLMTTAQKREILDKWSQVLKGKRSKCAARRALLLRETAVPLPQHIQPAIITPGASDASFSPSPSIMSTPDERLNLRNPEGDSPLAQEATSTARGRQDSTPRLSPALSLDSGGDLVMTLAGGDDTDKVSQETIVIEDDSSSAESLADSDDLPITHAFESQGRRKIINKKSSSIPSKSLQRRHLRERHLLSSNKTASSSSRNVGTLSGFCVSEQVRSGSEELTILGDSSTTADRAFPEGTVGKNRGLAAKQLARSSVSSEDREPPDEDFRHFTKKIKRLEQRLGDLETRKRFTEERWKRAKKRQKKLLSGEQRGIDDLRRSIDCLAIELRIREEHRLSRR